MNKKARVIQQTFKRLGYRRWTHQGEQIDNELMIDQLEYVYATCTRAQFKFKVDAPRFTLTPVIQQGDRMWSMDSADTVFWVLPMKFFDFPGLPSALTDVADSFDRLATAFAIPARMLQEAESSIVQAQRLALQSVGHLFMPTNVYTAWLEFIDSIKESEPKPDYWHTPEDLSWLSPDGGEYSQRYHGGD